jgi:hypothetical protein
VNPVDLLAAALCVVFAYVAWCVLWDLLLCPLVALVRGWWR